MWGAATMTAPGVHCDIRPYEKSVHLPKGYFLQNLDRPLLHKIIIRHLTTRYIGHLNLVYLIRKNLNKKKGSFGLPFQRRDGKLELLAHSHSWTRSALTSHAAARPETLSSAPTKASQLFLLFGSKNFADFKT